MLSCMETTGLLTSSLEMVTGPPLADCCTFYPETVPAAGKGRAQPEKAKGHAQRSCGACRTGYADPKLSVSAKLPAALNEQCGIAAGRG